METTDFSYSEKPPFRISKAPAQGLRHGHPRFAAQGLLFPGAHQSLRSSFPFSSAPKPRGISRTPLIDLLKKASRVVPSIPRRNFCSNFSSSYWTSSKFTQFFTHWFCAHFVPKCFPNIFPCVFHSSKFTQFFTATSSKFTQFFTSTMSIFTQNLLILGPQSPALHYSFRLAF